MREQLERRNGERSLFYGTFERLGTKRNWHGFDDETVLLKDITDLEGRPVCDHLWFNMTKGFSALKPLVSGTRFSFYARVTPYEKGYRGRRFDDETVLCEDVFKPIEIDYRLSHPSKITKIVIANEA